MVKQSDLSNVQEVVLKKAANLVEEKSAFILVTGSAEARRNFLEDLAGHFKSVWLVLCIGKKNIDDSLLEQLAASINVPKQRTVSALTAEVHKKLAETNRKILLICNDAEIFTPEELEAIRQLSNLPNSHKKGLSILLCGRPGLISKLNKKNCAAINQRITGRLSLKDQSKFSFALPFPFEELPAFIIVSVVAIVALIVWQFGNNMKVEIEQEVPVSSMAVDYSKPKQLSYVFATEEEALASFNGDSDSSQAKLANQLLRQKIKTGRDWLAMQPDNHYTIQLFLLGDIEAIVQNKRIMAEAQVIPILQKGKSLFAICKGSFATFEDAKKNIPSLPVELAVSGPFPKKMSIVKAQITNLPE